MAHHDDATEDLRIKSTDADTEGHGFKFRPVVEPAPDEAEGHAVRRGATEDQPMDSDEGYRFGKATDDSGEDTEGHGFDTHPIGEATDDPSMDPDGAVKFGKATDDADTEGNRFKSYGTDDQEPSMEPDEALRWRP